MKLHIDDERAKQVKSVKVDGKLVATAIELDTDEGWVKAYSVPVITVKESSSPDLEDLENENNATGEIELDTVMLHGKVEVEFLDSE